MKNKKNLTFEESKTAFLDIMSGKVKEEIIHDFLTFLCAKGETSDEIAGGVYVLRDKATKVNVSDDTVDTCGTGGDGKNTLNISTAAALLLSSFGIKVAKHGNKSVSSKCGSADVLEKLEAPQNPKVDYSQMSKADINKEYDKLRMAGDVFKAKEEAGPNRIGPTYLMENYGTLEINSNKNVLLSIKDLNQQTQNKINVNLS